MKDDLVPIKKKTQTKSIIEINQAKGIKEDYWSFLAHMNSFRNDKHYFDGPTKVNPKGSLKRKDEESGGGKD